MGNNRGNTYSKRHKYLKKDNKKFWEWSFDEMAQYDLPAMVKYILKKTDYNNIYYVGVSEGTLLGFLAFSTDQQFWNDKVNRQYS
jgi:lysosomal acid lipase/cholesteryl ester hydrolase